jgi:hypothetical protein
MRMFILHTVLIVSIFEEVLIVWTGFRGVDRFMIGGAYVAMGSIMEARW